MKDKSQAEIEKTTSKSLKSQGDVYCFLRYSWFGASSIFLEGQTVNKEYYLAVLKRLHEKIRQKRPNLGKNNAWILHDDMRHRIE